MWWTFFSFCSALGLVAVSHRQLVALRELQRLAALHLGRGPASGERTRVADLNEATIDIGSGLARAGIVPRSCAKAALCGGALAAIVQSAELLGGVPSTPAAEPAVWAAPLLSFVAGCVGAAVCSYIGRLAEVQARGLRADWATLIREFVRDVPT